MAARRRLQRYGHHLVAHQLGAVDARAGDEGSGGGRPQRGQGVGRRSGAAAAGGGASDRRAVSAGGQQGDGIGGQALAQGGQGGHHRPFGADVGAGVGTGVGAGVGPGEGVEHAPQRLEHPVAAGRLGQQALAFDGGGGQVGVERHQLEMGRMRAPGCPGVRRDHAHHAVGVDDGHGPGRAHPRGGGRLAEGGPGGVAADVLGHHCEAPLGGHAHEAAGGSDRQHLVAGQERLGHSHGRPAVQDRRPLAPPVEQMDAQRVDPAGGRQGRDDEWQRRRRLHLGELVHQAAQALQLGAGAGVGRHPRHQRHQVVGVQLARRGVGHDPAVAQHDDAVGQPEHLLDAVRHEQQGVAGGAAPAEQSLHRAGLADAQRGGGLIEDQHAGLLEERPGDGQDLALSTRQQPDGPAQIVDDDAQFGQQGLSPQVHVGVGQPHPPVLAPEEQVGDGVEVVAHGQVLPHHRQGGRPAGDLDRAGVGHHSAGDAVDERRLPGAVLADGSDQLARMHRQVDPVEHQPPTEPLGEAAHAQDGRGGRRGVLGGGARFGGGHDHGAGTLAPGSPPATVLGGVRRRDRAARANTSNASRPARRGAAGGAGARCRSTRLGGDVPMGRPAVSVTTSSSRSGSPDSTMSPSWTARWWALHKLTKFELSVGPPCSQCQM